MAVEEIPTLVAQQVVRLTVDLLRPVPLQPLTVESRIVREGKRIQVAEAALLVEGVEVARCSALRFRVGDLGSLEVPGGMPWPGAPPVGEAPSGGLARDRELAEPQSALQFAFDPADGELFGGPTWFRMRAPLVDGEPTSPLARLAYLADVTSAIGHPFDLPVTGINADLSLNVVRHSSSEWFSVTGTGWTSHAGIGHSRADIADDRGVVALASLSRLVDPVASGQRQPQVRSVGSNVAPKKEI
jgi:hypothetical protein